MTNLNKFKDLGFQNIGDNFSFTPPCSTWGTISKRTAWLCCEDGAVKGIHALVAVEVSRTPVREALRMLQAEGLIEAQFQHRMHVTRVTPQEVDAVYAMWRLNQSLAMALTLPRHSAADLRRLSASHRAMRACCPPQQGPQARLGATAPAIPSATDRARRTGAGGCHRKLLVALGARPALALAQHGQRLARIGSGTPGLAQSLSCWRSARSDCADVPAAGTRGTGGDRRH